MLRRVRTPLAALAAILALAGLAPAALAESQPMRLLVPAYEYPAPGSAYWDSLAAAADRVPLGVILNPASGPGAAADPNYVAAVANLRAHGAFLYGYVYSSYGARPLATVLADVAAWQTLYGPDALFVDEMSNATDTATLDYYRAIYDFAAAAPRAWNVLGNPGTTTSELYLAWPCADALVTWENSAGYLAATPPAWTAGYGPERFVNLFYRVSNATLMRDAIALAARRNVGAVLVVSDTLPNPWDTIPPYWAEEIAMVETTLVPPPVLDAASPTARIGALAFAPNPMRRGESIRFDVRLDGGGEARILDASGRAWRRFALGSGASEWRWDGTDDAGRIAPPGVYFASVRASARAYAARFVRLP